MPDLVKTALADFVFEATKHALAEPAVARAAAHEPIEDLLIEPVPISDLELALRVVGNRRTRYFSIKVVEHQP